MPFSLTGLRALTIKRPTGRRERFSVSPPSRRQDNSSALSSICSSLPEGDPEGRCPQLIARQTLLQFSYFGLNEERCKSEKLFEAQFGLRFGRGRGYARSANAGKGAHKVAKLSFGSLSQEQQAQVRWLNRNDLLLYTEAVAIFNQRLQLYGISDDVVCEE